MSIPLRLAIQLLPRADVLRQDRIAQIDAEIAWLYREVKHLEGKCKSLIRRDENGGLCSMLDLQSKALREQVSSLDSQLSYLLEVEPRTAPPH